MKLDKKEIINKLNILCVLILVFALTILLSGCNKNFVKFTFENITDIATFHFDKTEYVVGDTANFTVELNIKYSNSNFSVYANNDLVNEVDGVYSYEITNENVNFEVKDYEINTYSYTLINNNGFNIITDVTKIVHGADFTFKIESQKYNDDYIVLVNNNEVSKINNEYTVKNVTENLVIQITNYTIKTFNIETILCDGVSVVFDNNFNSNSSTICYGEDLIFDVVFNEGYTNSEDFKVILNNEELTKTNDKYIFNNVTNDINIVVEGAILKTHTVNFVNADGINVVGENCVTYGNSYEFSFTLKEGYVFDDNFDILVNNVSVFEPNKFTYKIERVTQNLEIKFVGINRLNYQISYYSDDGCTINLSSNTVYYNEDLSFTISALPGYYIDYDIIYVEVNSEEVKPIDGVYTITNIKENININVYGVMYEEYSIISLPEGIEIELSDGNSWDNAFYYVYDEIKFTIQAKDGLKLLDNFELISNTGNLVYEDGIYILSNVTNDIEFTANNIIYVGYTFNYTNTPDYEIVVLNEKEVYNSGDYFEFKVNLLNGNTNCKVYINNQEISKFSDKYSYSIRKDSLFENEIIVEII